MQSYIEVENERLRGARRTARSPSSGSSSGSSSSKVYHRTHFPNTNPNPDYRTQFPSPNPDYRTQLQLGANPIPYPNPNKADYRTQLQFGASKPSPNPTDLHTQVTEPNLNLMLAVDLNLTLALALNPFKTLNFVVHPTMQRTALRYAYWQCCPP